MASSHEVPLGSSINQYQYKIQPLIISLFTLFPTPHTHCWHLSLLLMALEISDLVICFDEFIVAQTDPTTPPLQYHCLHISPVVACVISCVSQRHYHDSLATRARSREQVADLHPSFLPKPEHCCSGAVDSWKKGCFQPVPRKAQKGSSGLVSASLPARDAAICWQEPSP